MDNVRVCANEFLCCDDKCTMRVLLNSPDDFCTVGDHSNSVFDHKQENMSRKRLDIAYDLLGTNPTERSHKIIEIVHVQLELPITEDEKQALRVSSSESRRRSL